MTEVRFMPPVAKYLKKIKDKKLKGLFQDAINKIREDHTVGEAKTGDLRGIFGYDIYYNKTNYELAYTPNYTRGVPSSAPSRKTDPAELRRLNLGGNSHVRPIFQHYLN